MSDRPLVSVVVPFHNAERFLSEAIESVLAQTYPDWELALVDDGSTDTSPDIARAYEARHPKRIRYLTHPDRANHGPSSARNLGIACATGDYVAFLDADDVWLSPKLAQQTEILAAYPEAAMVYGVSEWWHGWTGKLADIQQDRIRLPCVPSDVLYQPASLLVPFYVREWAEIPSMSNLIVRRSTLVELGGFENSFRNMYEDQVFHAKVVANRPVFVSTRWWDRRRQHRESITACAVAAGEWDAARAGFLKWLVAYLSQLGSISDEVIASLRRQRFRYRYPRLDRATRKLRRAA